MKKLLIILTLLLTTAYSWGQSTFTVTNTNDSGPGSLRQAIIEANNDPDASVIEFGIERQTITLQSTLPNITAPVIIDGRNAFMKIIGNSSLSGTYITETASGSGIYHLTLQGFNRAITVQSNNCTIFGNTFIGNNIALDISSSSAIEIVTNTIVDNREGIVLNYCNDINIGGGATVSFGNRIYGQTDYGIHVVFGNQNIELFGNTIGLYSNSSPGWTGNGKGGVYIQDGNSDIFIGKPNQGNVISGNNGFGILVEESHQIYIKSNLIGTSISSWTADGIGNSEVGIGLLSTTGQAYDIHIGGEEVEEGNAIVGHDNVQEGRGIYAAGIIGLYIKNNQVGVEINESGISRILPNEIGIELSRCDVVEITNNLISGNNNDGLLISATAASGNNYKIFGNVIGTDRKRSYNFGNKGSGIKVSSNASNINIGDVSQNPNYLFYNGRQGIVIDGAKKIDLSNNLSYLNESQKIQLSNNGNNSKAAPTIDVSKIENGNYRVIVNASPSDRVDIFGGDAPQHALSYFGAFTADESGQVVADLPLDNRAGYVQATATDSQGNTSELGFTENVDLIACSSWTKELFIDGGYFYNISQIEMVTDNDGSSYICGEFSNEAIIDGNTIINGDRGTFLVKVDANGSLIWSKYIQLLYGGHLSITLDESQENLFISGNGNFKQIVFVDDDSLSFNEDVYGKVIAKYTTNGSLEWVLRGESTSRVTAHTAMETDLSGNLYVSTGFTGKLTFGSFSIGEDNLESSHCILKVSPTGQVLWMQKVSSNSSYEDDIAISPDGTYGYVTHVIDRLRDPIILGDGTTIPPLDRSRIFLIKFSDAGSVLDHRLLLNTRPSNTINRYFHPRIDFNQNGEVIFSSTYAPNQSSTFLGELLSDNDNRLLATLDVNEDLSWVSTRFAEKFPKNDPTLIPEPFTKMLLSKDEKGVYWLDNNYLSKSTSSGLTLWQKNTAEVYSNVDFDLKDESIYLLNNYTYTRLSSGGFANYGETDFSRIDPDLLLMPLEESNLCTGQTIAVPFELFCASSNRWRAELIDINNNNTVVATGVGTSSPIVLTIPLALTGGDYIIRVVEDIELGDEFIGSSNYLTVNISVSTLALAPLEEVDYCASQVVPYSFTESCPNPSLSYQLELSLPDQELFGTPPQVIAIDVAPSGEFTLPTDLVTGTYYVRVASSNGLYSNNQTLTIVGGTPQITLAGYSGDTGNNTTNGTESCSASAGNLSFEVGCPTEGSDYEVQLSSLNSTTFAANPPVLGSGEASPIAVSNLPTEAGTYYLRVVSSEGVTSDLLPIDIKAPLEMPTVTINPGDNSSQYCEGLPLRIVATGNPAYTYEWTIEGQTYFGRDITHTPSSDERLRIELIISYQGCSLEVPVERLDITKSPSITIEEVNNPSCGDASDGRIEFRLGGYILYNYELYRNGNLYTESTPSWSSFTGSLRYRDLPAGIYTLEASFDLAGPVDGCSVTSAPVELTGQGPTLSEVCLSKIPCSNGTAVSAPTLSFQVSYPNDPVGTGSQYQYQVFKEGQSTPFVSGLTNANANISLDPADLVAGELLRLEVAATLDCSDGNCSQYTPYCAVSQYVRVENPQLTLTLPPSSESSDNPVYYTCIEDDTYTLPVALTDNLGTCDVTSDLRLVLYDNSNPASRVVVETITSPSHDFTLAAGQYLLEGHLDAYGCMIQQAFAIKSLENVTLDVLLNPLTCDDGGEALVVIEGYSGDSQAITYTWQKEEAGSWVTLVDENSNPLVGSSVSDLEAGNYQVMVQFAIPGNSATCEVTEAFTIEGRPIVENFLLSNSDDAGSLTCTLRGSAEINFQASLPSHTPTSGTYQVAWHYLEVQLDENGEPLLDETTGEPITQDLQIFTEEVISVEEAGVYTIASYLPEKHFKAGQYYLVVTDETGCVFEMTPPQLIEKPGVEREYILCLTWGTPTLPPVEEDEEVTELPTIAASDAKGTLLEKVNQCVTAQVEGIALAVEAACSNTQGTLSFAYQQATYHYTLYYYDRAGRLTKTVPPAGVRPLSVVSRDNRPAHTMATTYDYNSLQQLVYQNTPDGGETKLLYDRKGQLRFSENERQRDSNQYSYSVYDELGRVVEVGQQTKTEGSALPNFDYTSSNPNSISATNEALLNDPAQATFPSGATGNSEQTFTVYNTPKEGVYYYSEDQPQRYLENRVSYTYTINKGDSDTTQAVYTYYSYDIHGNVAWMIQDLPGIPKMYVAYDYDLISGKVTQVRYNEGSQDQFFHRYRYDEDNRLVEVRTSRDGLLWDKEALYDYYKHGPLKRLELGEDHLQGLDYVYTLHGWLKGINSPTHQQDVGKDGQSIESRFAADLFGMALHYYRGDYKNKDANNPFDQSSNLAYQISNADGEEQELFNGNIAAWSHHMQRYQPGSGGQPATWQSEAITSTYRYDQLNRIKSSRERQWNGTSTSWASPSNVHATNYSYDQNGNITQLQRRDAAGNLLDNITYTYETDENGNKINRLQEVNDPTVTADPSDIEGKHGFTYDQQGNLSRDEKEKTNIDWNNQNKVHQVRQEEADKAHITFRYDAAGNRIEKEVNRNDLLPDGSRSYADPTKVVTTYYVRDAQGNVMSIYEKTHRQKEDGSYESVLTQKETYLYGSDRLGVERQAKVVGITQSASAAEAVDAEIAEIAAPEVVNTNSDTPPTSNGLLPNGDEVIVEPTSKDQYEDRSYWVLTTPGGVLDLAEGFEVNVNNAEGFFAEVAEWEDIRTEEEVYVSRIVGKKQYELKDHLSNVRVVLSDQKEVVNIDETAGTYEQRAKVLSYNSFYPYGTSKSSYNRLASRFSFNSQERTPEINDNHYTALFWEYDSRTARRWNLDPKPNPSISQYNVFAGNPIIYNDILGDTIYFVNNKGEVMNLKRANEASTYLRRDVLLRTPDGKEILEKYENSSLHDIYITTSPVNSRSAGVTLYEGSKLLNENNNIDIFSNIGSFDEKEAIANVAQLANFDGVEVKNPDTKFSLISINEYYLEGKGNFKKYDDYDKAETLFHEITSHILLHHVGDGDRQHKIYGGTYTGIDRKDIREGSRAYKIGQQLRLLRRQDRILNMGKESFEKMKVIQPDNTKVGSGQGF